jgi:beta-xylosidase
MLTGPATACLLCAAALSTAATAYQGMSSGADPTPKLHVSGRFLQDSAGRNVTLHGYMQPGASWFNGEGRNFRDPGDYTDPASFTPALDYFRAVADVLSDPSPRFGRDHGWYCSYVRYIADGSGPHNFAPGWDAEGDLARPEQFAGWVSNVLVPFVQHCRSRGLYVILVGNPSETFPSGNDGKPDPGRNMTRQYQRNLILFWTLVASHPAIRGADNVHFEICNEPITIETRLDAGDWGMGGDAFDRAITAFMQPVVDAIRGQGADNVIWIPGLGWQGQYAGFARHPVQGDNLGYAAHLYPAYGGAHDDPAAVARLWETNYKPAADRWPMVITEMFWNPNSGEGYQGLWNAHTDGFGNAIRARLDRQGNVSFQAGMVGDLFDNLKGGLAEATLGTSEAARAAFDWYHEYATAPPVPAPAQTPGPSPDPGWTSDNGDGTFTNPVLFGDYPDPDIIRVGADFYLVTTTFVSMPGLQVLRSRDLVNWQTIGYAAPTLDVDPAYSLEGGSRYAAGVWAPSLRYHQGTFYIVDNIQGAGTVVYRATDPAGPWATNRLDSYLFDPGLLFDDDGTPLVYHGTNGSISLAVLDAGLTRVIFSTPAYQLSGGEGSHAYKVNGTYCVFNALFGEFPTLLCSRSQSRTGPFTTVTVCDNHVPWSSPHQGGMVQLENGDWWGFSLVDSGAVGRTTWLGPITWRDGWPYFGDPAAPSIALTCPKPSVGAVYPITPLPASDEFDGPSLAVQWQWNHNPDDSKWSLSERPGFLRLHAPTAPGYALARNTLTQRTEGRRCAAVVKLDTSGLQPGDRAGLSLLQQRFGYLAVYRDAGGEQRLVRAVNGNDDLASPSEDITDTVEGVAAGELWLRASCDFTTNQGQFSYSTDGVTYTPVGEPLPLRFTLATFQGVRFGIFCYNPAPSSGWLDVDYFRREAVPRP